MNALRAPISAVLTDVDGTLVTKDKVLTPRALEAVARLRERGIVFTITSGRPPFGMRMLVEPLGLAMPMAAFNGGVIVLPDLSLLDERLLPEYLLPALIAMIEAHGLDVWLFRTYDWFVRAADAYRVSRETSNIQQAPVVVSRFDGVLNGVVKVVGVSQDHPRVAACEAVVQQAFGAQVSAARSQPHYLDVTHPMANKGVVIERLSRYLRIPLERIAAIGDQPNDVLMFERSGLSIAMANASEEVKRKASVVTTSYADEGFANAVERIILPRAEPAGRAASRPTGRLHRLGQSIWLDGMTPEMLRSGALKRYVDELAVTGVTGPLGLGLDDVRHAADLLRGAYDRSAGVDGWISVKAPPELYAQAERPNLMIEIQGVPANLPAIEQAIFGGIPVNVGMLFSREHYLAAAEAFLRGLERRVEAGLAPDVVSVASMSVSPWDAALRDKVPDPLGGRLGVAMAQRTYVAYRALLHSPRWQRIYNAGARTQRLLWVGTAAGKGAPSDLVYAEALTAPFTVLGVNDRTLTALGDHGGIKTLLRADGRNCEETIARFTAAGVDVYALATRLQADEAGSLG